MDNNRQSQQSGNKTAVPEQSRPQTKPGYPSEEAKSVAEIMEVVDSLP